MHRFAIAAVAAAFVLGLTGCAGAPADKGASPGPAPMQTIVPASGPAALRLANADGSTFSLADVPGKAKVVNVWATWCAPCIKEMPILNAMSKKYTGKDVTFVAVSVDEGGSKDVEALLKRGVVSIDFRQAYASFDQLAAIDVKAPIPDTLVFDGNNRLVAHFDKIIEEAELESAIAKAMQGGAAQ